MTTLAANLTKETLATMGWEIIFLIPFYLQAVQIHLANVVELLEA
jgi:hypothetical protein